MPAKQKNTARMSLLLHKEDKRLFLTAARYHSVTACERLRQLVKKDISDYKKLKKAAQAASHESN